MLLIAAQLVRRTLGQDGEAGTGPVEQGGGGITAKPKK
jgi:hypothetical protein